MNTIRNISAVLLLSSLALAALGVSYSVATGSIDGREIKNNSVTTPDLRNNSAPGRDVKDDSLTGRDINESTLSQVAMAAAVADGEVTTQKLADLAVTTQKLANPAVSTDKLFNLAITTEKLVDGAVTSAKLADGAVRATRLGPTVIRRGGGVPVAPGTSNVAVAACLDGETRLSGGGGFSFGANRGIQASFPQGTGWVVWGRNNTGQEQILAAQILCLQN